MPFFAVALVLAAAAAVCAIAFAQQASPTATPARTQEELDYINYSDSTWNLFWEDFSECSYVLDRYAAGNITASTAFAETASAYALCSHTVDMIEGVKPPESQNFRDFHNLTVLSVLGLRAYLWSTAKYYETANIVEWCNARYKESGNKSQSFLAQADHYRRLNANHYQAMSNYFNQTVEFIEAAKRARIEAVEF